jgi:hypothetical protein
MMLCCVVGMLFGMSSVAVGSVSMMSRCLVVTVLMMAGRSGMMLGGLFVMLGSLLVVVGTWMVCHGVSPSRQHKRCRRTSSVSSNAERIGVGQVQFEEPQMTRPLRRE